MKPVMVRHRGAVEFGGSPVRRHAFEETHRDSVGLAVAVYAAVPQGDRLQRTSAPIAGVGTTRQNSTRQHKRCAGRERFP